MCIILRLTYDCAYIIFLFYIYRANNGLLSRADYGNGAYTGPIYDELDRKIGMKYNGVKSYELYYGADGRVGLLKDLENGVNWRYEYDRSGSLTAVSGSNGSRFSYAYDTASGKLISSTVTDGSESRTVSYA